MDEKFTFNRATEIWQHAIKFDLVAIGYLMDGSKPEHQIFGYTKFLTNLYKFLECKDKQFKINAFNGLMMICGNADGLIKLQELFIPKRKNPVKK